MTTFIDLWHVRLCHPSYSTLDVVHKYVSDILSSYNKIFHCPICPIAKQKHLPFSHIEHITTFVFQLIHCDIWGSISIFTFDGFCYFLSIVDDYSWATWIYLMKQKFDTEPLLQSFFTLVKTQSGTKIQIIRTKHGLEFAISDFFSHQNSMVE